VVLGDVELLALPDAVGELGELAELYPEVGAESWDPYREMYPELFAGSSAWRLPCACYLIRASGTAILVDTGVGPPGLWGWAAEREGQLPSALGEHGLSRDDVDVVFLTHLHIDHLGWNTDEDGVAFFPRARYLVHREALAFARTRPELPHIRRCVEPLVDRFEQLEAEVEIATGVTAFPVPGHYPGHMGLRIRSGQEEAVVIADAAVHPALLDRPDWRYVSDLDHDRCVVTRRALLEELVESEVVVVCGHYPHGGIGSIIRLDDRIIWKAAA
jgi:glyoxylase-like metal-dependent hydrolase (beta-lactamase superfamily II)